MPIVNAKEMLLKATREKYGVGAFNITSIVQMEAVIEAHVERKAPVIIQTLIPAAQFLGAEVMVAVYRTLAESAPVPVCLHLDHGTDVNYCKHCADVGYTNIMIDASRLPFEENIRRTKEVVDYCHKLGGITVEGELGTICAAEVQGQDAVAESELCNTQQALEFVECTGVDFLAPSIGTAHGVYTTTKPRVDFERVKEISELINGSSVRVPLVVHGGTGLSRDYVERLVASGAAKVNVATELKHCLIDATYQYISEHRQEYDPGSIDQAAKDATRRLAFNWIDWLGSAGQA